MLNVQMQEIVFFITYLIELIDQEFLVEWMSIYYFFEWDAHNAIL